MKSVLVVDEEGIFFPSWSSLNCFGGWELLLFSGPNEDIIFAEGFE